MGISRTYVMQEGPGAGAERIKRSSTTMLQGLSSHLGKDISEDVSLGCRCLWFTLKTCDSSVSVAVDVIMVIHL